MNIRSQKGFTLIELLVVISIIGFLSSIVLGSLTVSKQKANDARIISDMRQLKNALELYALDHSFVAPFSSTASVMPVAKPLAIHKGVMFSVLAFMSKPAYAATHSNANCQRFDDLKGVLVPKYIGSFPQHPNDDGQDTCYKYYNNDTTAVVFGPMITEKYSNGYNKQTGAATGKTDTAALQAICAQSGFPVFDMNGSCSGESIADRIIGITSGSESGTPQDNPDDGGGGGGGGDNGTYYDTSYVFFGETYCSAGYTCNYGNGYSGEGYYGLYNESYYDYSYTFFGSSDCNINYNSNDYSTTYYPYCYYGNGYAGYGNYGRTY